MNNSEAINIIKKTCKRVFPKSRIMLFGSRARKDYSANSDFDFMIITKTTLGISEKRSYKAQLRKNLASSKIPADILIQSEEEIKLKKEIVGHIVREVMKEGVII